MYSLSIDYLFNRVYDVLLWIKYVWLFVLLRKNPDEYIVQHSEREYDGLRDRGWFDEYLAQKDAVVPNADVHVSLWHKVLESFGIRLPDSDNDGIPNVADEKPYDPSNVEGANLKERYEADYTLSDHFRDAFGLEPRDHDKDGVPTSYEMAHSLDPNNPDTDRDGVFDGQELVQGSDPFNNDTDGDLVIDSRDEAPTDGAVTSLGSDTDGDGVSDDIEEFLGSNVNLRDTDADGISDNMDLYILDPENISQLPSLDFERANEGLSLSVQNPVLAFVSEILSVLTIAIILFFVYAVCRWLLTFLDGMNHYDHHFQHDDKHNSRDGESLHFIKHEDMPAGIPGLPVKEDVPAPPPSLHDFEDHPKFAIVKGYLSSQSEALWRIGILEADNLLAETLREKGYVGETLSDMLKSASFKTIQLAWDAHTIRNRVAHEGSEFELTEREAKRAFTLYESVFRELKVIK